MAFHWSIRGNLWLFYGFSMVYYWFSMIFYGFYEFFYATNYYEKYTNHVSSLHVSYLPDTSANHCDYVNLSIFFS